MKKFKIAVSAILVAGCSLCFSSCIGSFTMMNKVMSWNNQVGNKFVNELVFFCFWIIPVYEVSFIIDIAVLNSIEFWSGSNPMTAHTKVVDTENGRYLIACDGKGYTITHKTTGESMRMEFIEDSNSWAIEDKDGELQPFMTFVDDNHVKMIKPDGDFQLVELSQQGVMAYESALGIQPMAQR